MSEWLSLDFETKSTANLKQTGVYVYAEHPSTDVWCCAYAFDDEDPDIWFPDRPLSNRVIDHMASGGKLRGWNVAFERIITQKIVSARYGWPLPKLNQWWDTAAQAAAAALPRALDNAAAALGMKIRKDKEGYNLMMRMCKPRRIEQNGALVWWDDEARIKRLGEYCIQDVVVERGIEKRLRPLSESERLIYLLDQHINDKGVQLDQPLVEQALKIVNAAEKDLDRRLRDVTRGAVPRASLVERLKTWLADQGVKADLLDDDAEIDDKLESLDKQAMKALLESEIPPDARTAIEIRAEAAKSSTKKLVSMQRACCDDGRMRGLLLYHGAGTGRWAGKLVQPQNFPKGTIKNTEAAIRNIQHGNAEEIEIVWGSPLDVVASCLRGFMVPKAGYRFIVCDFAAIEARVLAWLAQETQLVDLFATGGDPYCYMAERLFNRPITKANFVERFIGKQLVLGCGYQMGPSKFIATCNKLSAELKIDVKVDMKLAEPAIATYRETNTRIVDLWRDLEDAAFEAVRRPGITTTAAFGRIKFRQPGDFLYMALPSGRVLSYARAFIGPRVLPWGDIRDGVRFFSVPSQTATKKKLSDEDRALPGTMPGRWEVTDIYGGKWCENAVQAIARDLLAQAMLRLEKRGYNVVLTVHDEVVCEVPHAFGSVHEVSEIMCERPAWALDCPIAAEGFETDRYRKG